MKAIYICLFALATSGLSSCFEDKSTEAINAVSKIEISTPLQERYTAERWSTITINAPQITQTNGNKPLSYEWQVNYKVVGTDPNLSYLCEEYGKFPARLKITNGDEIKYIEFIIDVPLPYGKGLYALGEKDGKVILSYEPIDTQGKVYALDVLSANNPRISFTGEPHSIMYDAVIARTSVPSMFIGLQEGGHNRIYTLHADSMLVTRNTQLNAPAEFILQRMANTNIVAGGEQLNLNFNENFITNTAWRTSKQTFGEIQIAGSMIGWSKNASTNLHGIALWDNTNGRFLAIGGDDYATIPATPVGEVNEFKGYKLMKMLPANGRQKIAVFLQKDNEDAVYHALIHPGLYNYSGATTQASVEHKGAIPSNAMLNKQSIITSAPNKDIAYYSNGANIYGYSLKSNGNFEAKILMSLSNSNATIVDMLVSQDEKYLYVGANSPSGELVGSLYCYDLNDNHRLVWEKKNVTGKIKKLVIRPE